MKKSQVLFAIFCLFLITTCTTEEEVPKDLSVYDNYIIAVTVFYIDSFPGDYAEYTIIDYTTDGSNKLVSFSNAYSETIGFGDTTNQIDVKAYKTVGIKLRPEQNIKGFKFLLYKIDEVTNNPLEPLIDIERDLSSPNEEINISYNFETEETSFLPLD